MNRQAPFPVTGDATNSHAAAAAKTRRHADTLAAKDAGIHAAAKTPAGRDASAENAARVKRTTGPWAPNRDSMSDVTRTTS